MSSAAIRALRRMHRTVAERRHRGVVVVSGDDAECLERTGRLLEALAIDDVVLISCRAVDGWTRVDPGRARGLLGAEAGAVVFDAFSGFDPDALGAAAGTVTAGGLVLLLTPPLEHWQVWPDPDGRRLAVPPVAPASVPKRFLGRVARIVARHPFVLAIASDGGLVRDFVPAPAPLPVPAAVPDPDCATLDQCGAVEAILRVARGHRRRPLVLTAHRGRGKSAALGIGAARLIGDGFGPIVVTAPRLAAAAAVFRHAARLLGLADGGGASLRTAAGSMRFLAPDVLVRDGPHCSLLLVDEAAAIPAPMLEQLLERYPRIAFASTVHGYEGAGRGFAVRFRATLERRTPRWRGRWLEEPIRFAAGDPAERFLFDLLLLDAAPADDEDVAGTLSGDCEAERLDRDRLAADDALLRQVFGLLVLAHYRTRPSDLRRLLDGPNLQVHVLRRAERVMATALVAREGGFDAETATDIWSGRRRPHGHLLPESLAFHLGVEEAATLRFSRIVRIAVHPALRRRGLGLRLVAAVEDEARRDGADFTGTSFGADIGLLRFWGRAGMAPVRIGVKRGATSGAWSVLMTKPLSEAGRRIQERMRARHRERLPALLGDPLADLDLALADVLLEPGDEPAPAPPDREAFAELASFAYASRTFEAAYPVLASLAPAALSCASLRAALPAADRHLLIARLLQHRSFAATATLLGLSGRDEVVRRLRSAVAAVLDTLDHEHATALAERLRPRC